MSERREHDEFVEAVLSGEKDPADPKVIRFLADNPEVARRVRELSELADQLDEAGREQRATLAESRELEPAEEQVAVANGLRELIANGSARAPSRAAPEPLKGQRLSLLLFAAAILAVLPFAWNAFLVAPSGDSGPSDVMLGSNPFELEVVRGEESSPSGLRWSFPLSSGGWFSLVVTDPSAGAETPTLYDIPRYTGHEWKPSEHLPSVIRVELEALDASGEIERAWAGELSVPD